MRELLEESRRELLDLDADFRIICKNSTPVLYFGNLSSAEVVTVGYNPSASEFLCSECERTVDRLSFFDDSEIFKPLPTDRIDYILRRMTGYFSNKPYRKWFDRWSGGLAGRDYYNGTAAHTDILSPFATIRSYGDLKRIRGLKERLEAFGFPMWIKVMRYAKQVKLIIGIGQRSLDQLSKLGEFEGCDVFDHFAKASKPDKPWTYTGTVVLDDGRKIKAVIWLPYLGNPLEWMDSGKRAEFSRFCQGIID